MATSDVGRLQLSDSDPEDLFASPSKPSRKDAARSQPQGSAERGSQRGNAESKYDVEQAREGALRKELEGVRHINEVIEGVLSSLAVAKGNMESVSQTVTSASTLLNTWVRILSQTEHNQRLILNPDWKGASQDVADMENETVLKAQAAQRRAAEEERRRQDARRKAEDEERQRQAGTATRGTRGRARGSTRGGGIGRGSVSSGYGAPSGSSGIGRAGGSVASQTSSLTRRGSQIGRGTGARGRARGSK